MYWKSKENAISQICTEDYLLGKSSVFSGLKDKNYI